MSPLCALAAPLAAVFSAAPATSPGAPDFSAAINFGPAAFGFVAYRHGAYVLFGAESAWLPLPSWAFALALLTLALLEYWAARFLVTCLRRAWRRRQG